MNQTLTLTAPTGAIGTAATGAPRRGEDLTRDQQDRELRRLYQLGMSLERLSRRFHHARKTITDRCADLPRPESVRLETQAVVAARNEYARDPDATVISIAQRHRVNPFHLKEALVGYTFMNAGGPIAAPLRPEPELD